MNYRQKRNNKRLSLYTVAKELGIDRKKYEDIESGKREFEGNLLEKWYEIMDNAVDIKFRREARLYEIRHFFTSGEAKEKLKEFNYSALKLSEILGYGKMAIYNCLNNKGSISDDVREEIYDFLHDNLNKNIENNNTIKTTKNKTKKSKKESSALLATLAKVGKKIKSSQQDVIPTEVVSKDELAISNEAIEKDKDEYIKKLEKQIMLYEKLIMRL